MNGLGIRPNIRFAADDVKTLEFPENVAGRGVHGIEVSVGAFFSHIHLFSVRRKSEGADESASYGMAPFLPALFG